MEHNRNYRMYKMTSKWLEKKGRLHSMYVASNSYFPDYYANVDPTFKMTAIIRSNRSSEDFGADAEGLVRLFCVKHFRKRFCSIF